MASAARLAAVAVVLAGSAFTAAAAAATPHFPNPSAQQEKEPAFWYHSNREALEQRLKAEKREGRAHNVILFIGDGMGLSTITAARVFKGQLAGKAGENSALSFEKFPHTSLSKVYCVDRLVPDSACSGTAIQCGVKSNYYTLGVSAHVTLNNCTESSNPRHHLKCLYELAQEADKSTGFATTAAVTDATVAAGYAHSAHREWESSVGGKSGDNCLDIAHQLVHRPPGLQLRFIAGGGREHFLVPEEAVQRGQPGKRPDSRNLIEEWTHLKQADRMNAHVCITKEDVENLDTETTDTVLALLASGDLPYENLDDIRKGTSLLTKLTEKAIQILSKNPDGFVLLVEAGQIDKGHHESLAHRSLAEVLSLDLAVAKAVEMTRPDETLIVVTADHGHTFVMGGKPQRGANVFGVDNKQHPRTVLNYAVGPGHRRDYSNLTLEETSREDFAFPSAYWEKAGTHSGEDVAVFAYGPYAHLFSGVHEQTYIYEVIRYAAGLDDSSYSTRRQSLFATVTAWVPGPVKYALALAVVFYLHMFVKTFL
ncbi:alkaline phosphatase-like isoform X1 [Dermacentor albipictus]|uniref:alkaline phosphatase-like isoform X1 n=1 Tax=Dermacentor albipictus TaxID=60249 RepID=UPI0038FCC10C